MLVPMFDGLIDWVDSRSLGTSRCSCSGRPFIFALAESQNRNRKKPYRPGRKRRGNCQTWRCTMRKTLIAAASAAGIAALVIIAAPSAAEARWGWGGGWYGGGWGGWHGGGWGWRRGWGWGGAALGAGLGLALTTPYYGYDDYPYYGYGYPYSYPPYYGGYYRPYYAPRYYARRYYYYR